jgi:hypothetical protein
MEKDGKNMDDGFVIIMSKIVDSTPAGMEKGMIYGTKAQLFIATQNGKDVFEDIQIIFMGRPPEIFFTRFVPGLECLLQLRREAEKEYRCESAVWYRDKAKKTFHLFGTGEEISKEKILINNPRINL